MLAAMQKVMARYNSRVEQLNKVRREHNLSVKAEFDAGSLRVPRAELTGMLLEPLLKSSGKPSKMALMRFKRRFGWTARVLSAPSTSLPYDHPKIANYRAKFSLLVETKKIKRELILNYDQVWRLKWRGPKSKLYKCESQAGVQKDTEGKNAKRLCAAMTGQSGEDAEERPRKRGRLPWDSSGKEEVAVASVIEARHPHTVVTSIWGNGDVGPLVYFFAAGTFPQKEADRLNKKFRGRLYICFAAGDTHFMCGETTLRVWEEFYTYVLHQRRIKMDMRDDVACLLFDSFTGNSSGQNSLSSRRDLWMKTNNCIAEKLEPCSSDVRRLPRLFQKVLRRL
jgi:hypothetical protein